MVVEATATIELDGQYRVLREGAGYLERAGRGQLVVRGAEAADYLQGQLTNDVEALEPGAGCYSALLDRKGRMQGDMRVLRIAPEELWLDMEPEALEAVRRHLSMYKVGRDVEIDDESAARTIVSVIGPAAVNATGSSPLGPEHSHRELELGGASYRAVATDLGLDLLLAASQRDALVAALREGDAAEISEAAAEIVRVESGRPRFAREMTTETIPQEAGINERAVSFTKGCYIGQETVARLHYKGKPNRHLRGLRLQAPAVAGDAIVLGEREVGHVGTSVLSPALGPIALAIVRREAEPGSTVVVGEGISAEVIELPFGSGASERLSV
jgi:folate-binding protein YgfZ